jgi:hypothetical protein
LPPLFYFAPVINSAVIIRESAAAKKRFLLGKLVSRAAITLLSFHPKKRVCFIATDFNGNKSVHMCWLVIFLMASVTLFEQGKWTSTNKLVAGSG